MKLWPVTLPSKMAGDVAACSCASGSTNRPHCQGKMERFMSDMHG